MLHKILRKRNINDVKRFKSEEIERIIVVNFISNCIRKIFTEQLKVRSIRHCFFKHLFFIYFNINL